jgi:hypothetical protein
MTANGSRVESAPWLTAWAGSSSRPPEHVRPIWPALVFAGKPLAHVAARHRRYAWMEVRLVTPGIEQKRVVNGAVLATDLVVPTAPTPDDFATEVLWSEDAVEQYLEIVASRRVAVQIQAAG